jgi:hypothetical protein
VPQPITIQIQLEPDLTSDECLLRCKAAMIDAALKIECFGLVRYQMCLGLNVYLEPKEPK